MSDASPSLDHQLPPANRRLESWKAIADYLGRHVTTLQRWEHEEGLPVHRHHHEKRGSVYAFTAELDDWLLQRSVVSGSDAPSPDPQDKSVEGSPSHRLPEGGADQRSTVPSERVPGLHTPPQRTTGRGLETGIVAGTLRPKWRLPAWAIAAVAALALTIAAGVAKDFWPSGVGNEALSLAVLPLKNRSPNQQPDYFVDGMTEALTTDLASLNAVRVIASQSVRQYQDTGKSASEIAKELGVRALVEGSVQRSAGRVRVDIRLIDGTTSRSLWATTHERDFADALALQADISRAIVSELHLTLDPSQGERLGRQRPSNPEAWDAYLRARFFWNRRTHEDMAHAISWYERAIALDASSPLVFAGLADVYATLGPPNTPVSELITRGTSAANTAIALDPSMGEPFAALGKLRAYAWDWRGAEKNYRKAVELAPRYAPGRYWFGSFLANQGRCDEALLEAHEAQRLDPVSLPGNMVIAGIELKCDRVEQAIRRSKMILEFDPDFGQAYESLGRAYLTQGDAARAITMFERALALTGGRPTIQAALAFAYAVANRTAEAEAIATTLAGRHRQDKVLASAWSVAIAQAGLRNDEAALTWLEHAYDDREEWLEALAIDERFRNLHRNNRFQQLLRRLGISRVAAS